MRFDHGRVSHERIHNQYGLLMAMGDDRRAARRRCPSGARSSSRAPGFAGIQRYAANWMGDNQARWDHLWVSIPMAMGFGLSGQPFVGADIGGFLGDSERRAVPALDAVRDADAVLPQPLRDRQRRPVRVVVGRDDHRPRARRRSRCATGCCPTSTRRSSPRRETGAPVQRPLVFDHQHDPAVRDLDDEYLFGPDLLVAPGDRGRDDRAPGLPARGRLVRLAHRRALAGAGWFVLAPTPMDRIPLYARGGRRDPDVAGGAAVDRRPPPARGRAAPVRPARPTAARVVPAGGRRADVRRAATARAAGRRSPSPGRAAR